MCSESESCSVMSISLLPHGLYSPWNSLGQNTGVGSHSLLQGIFPTQGSNPTLPLCRWILYQLNHKGSPRILEWVAYPFSSRSFQPRNQTGVPCIAGRFFTTWATRKASNNHYHYLIPEHFHHLKKKPSNPHPYSALYLLAVTHHSSLASTSGNQ